MDWLFFTNNIRDTCMKLSGSIFTRCKQYVDRLIFKLIGFYKIAKIFLIT